MACLKKNFDGILALVLVLGLFYAQASAGKVCPVGWSLYGQEECIRYNPGRHTWPEARESCNKQGGDLVTVETEEKDQWIVAHLTSLKKSDKLNTGPFIGLNNFKDKNHFVWLNDTQDADYTRWYINKPSGHKNQCAAYIIDFEDMPWNDLRWSSPNSYLCQKEARDCGSDWEGGLGHCYQFNAKPSTWDKAEKYCQSIGGHLTSINSESETKFLTAHMKTMNIPFFWSGNKDMGYDEGWQWSDNSEFLYFNWGHGEPNFIPRHNYSGAVVTSSGKWFAKPGSKPMPFVCKK